MMEILIGRPHIPRFQVPVEGAPPQPSGVYRGLCSVTNVFLIAPSGHSHFCLSPKKVSVCASLSSFGLFFWGPFASFLPLGCHEIFQLRYPIFAVFLSFSAPPVRPCSPPFPLLSRPPSPQFSTWATPGTDGTRSCQRPTRGLNDLQETRTHNWKPMSAKY